MFHLNVRVAWHDNRWNGAVCNDPLTNSYCLDLERIRSSRDDDQEVKFKGKLFADISPDDLPPCKAESGAFMNSTSGCEARNIRMPATRRRRRRTGICSRRISRCRRTRLLRCRSTGC
jgi:hypothetical protein